MERIYTIDTRAREIDFEATEYVGRTLENARNLLLLRMGEVPYDRMRGIAPALLELDYAAAQNLITQEVTRALGWEPDVRVLAARILPAGDGTDGAFILEADVAVTEV